MNSTKNTAIATALTAILSLSAFAAQVADASPQRVMTMKPLQGVSFDVGTQHAVSYFLSEDGTCKLVVTLGAAPNWDEVASLTVTRFEAAVPARKGARFRSVEGKIIQFACHAGAKSMSVEGMEQVAVGAAR